MPQTSQPNAASLRTTSNPTPERREADVTTTPGLSAVKIAEYPYLRIGFWVGCTNDRGVESRPTRNAREKFSVAKAERNMPKQRSEKDDSSV
jgi:hypothetical protein